MTPEGKYQYGSVYGGSYREAKEKRLQVLQRRASEKTEKSNLFFKDVLILWQKSNCVRLKAASVSRYQYLIDVHIIPELGNIKMEQLTASMINTFLAEKLKTGRLDGQGGLSASYVQSIMLIINAATNYAASEQLCDPLKAKILKPPIPKKELPVLSRTDQERLEGSLYSQINETKLGVLISLYTGLRIGEVCALTWEDIDFDMRMIYVRHTIARVRYDDGEKQVSNLIVDQPKTRASLRTVPICSKLYAALQQFPVVSPDYYVVSGSKQFLSPRTYEYRYSCLLKQCQLQHFNYHALRHTFATRCIEVGMDVKALSEILGHSNASLTLNTYVHSSMELKMRHLDKIGC
jgi:integrase